MAYPILEQELNQVRDDVLFIGSLAETAIDQAMNALRDANLSLAKQVIEQDVEINQRRNLIEERTLQTLALRQPNAGDLRTLIATMNIAQEVERIGDYACGLAKVVLRRPNEPAMRPLLHLPTMTSIATELLRESMNCFVMRDSVRAGLVARRDDEIDRLYKEMFNQVVEIMAGDRTKITTGTYLLWAGHNLERIGDRVTNICERVIFMKTGAVEELND